LETDKPQQILFLLNSGMARVGGFSAQNSKVMLNVYDLHDNNDLLYQFGLGLFHSGVNIGREEYTFGIFTICFLNFLW
jgi:hypothetical protein